MEKHIIVGFDVHDATILQKLAVDRAEPEVRTFNNTETGRRSMIASLKNRSREQGGARVIFAYEASHQGFGLYDELTDAGFGGYVLAPTKIARSVKHQRRKTDERDADRILEIIRGHVLAGNRIPSVWIPDLQTRNDRELVRMRLAVGDKITATKAQVQSLLKRNKLRKASATGKNWTKKHRAWLGMLPDTTPDVPVGATLALKSLLRQLKMLEQEVVLLDKNIEVLSRDPRYATPVQELMKMKGVGMWTAMVFLTEMGDLSRFHNRQQVAAYLGLVPSSQESGERDDRKGHITHQGPARVRKALCQASWAIARHDLDERSVYRRIVGKNPKHKKIAVVALMRRLGIKMWHRGLEAQLCADCFQKQVHPVVA